MAAAGTWPTPSVDLTEVDEPGSYPYFLALQQDYEQMQRQQYGLRNEGSTT